ncbi:unnamed protein product, partial [Lymnaea stagnalis]
GLLNVHIDEHVLTSSSTFSYQPDPNILDVFPRKSILSGGIPITVKGNDLNASENPLMTGETTDSKALGVNTTCSVQDGGAVMVCPSMNVSGIIEPGGAQTYIYFMYDGTRWPQTHEYSLAFQYHADPVFLPFSKSIREFDVNQGEMIFPGLNILKADQKDYQVLVGKTVCTVVDIDEFELKCRP